jgi:hypothetical protein
MAAIGRNQACPCGSGLKYKRCCALKTNKVPLSSRIGIGLVGLMLLVGALFMLTSLNQDRGDGVPGRVWHGDHWDYPGQAH